MPLCHGLARRLLLAPPAPAAERVELYDATLQDFVEWSAKILDKPVVVGSDIRSAPISVFASYTDKAELERLLNNAVTSAGFHFAVSGGADHDALLGYGCAMV